MPGRSHDSPLVLAYHAVSEDWPAELAVTPAAFREQLEFLRDRGYHSVTFTEAVCGDPGDRAVAITFDDGFLSVLELAQPILASFGMVATVFTITRFADSGEAMSWPGVEEWAQGPFRHEMAPLSWEELRRLVGEGWEVGSHTHSHPRLTTTPDAVLREELQLSRSMCERELGRPCRSIAYPYGDLDERAVEAASLSGYVAGAGLPRRLTRPAPLAWPRIGVYRRDTRRRFGLKLSPTVRTLRRTPAAALGRLSPI